MTDATAAPLIDPALIPLEQRLQLVAVAARYRSTAEAIATVANDPGAATFLSVFADATRDEGRRMLKKIADEQRAGHVREQPVADPDRHIPERRTGVGP